MSGWPGIWPLLAASEQRKRFSCSWPQGLPLRPGGGANLFRLKIAVAHSAKFRGRCVPHNSLSPSVDPDTARVRHRRPGQTAAGGGPSRSVLVDALVDGAARATRPVLQVRPARPRSVFVPLTESRSAAARLSLSHLPLLYNSLGAGLTFVGLIEWPHADSSVPNLTFVLCQQVWLLRL